MSDSISPPETDLIESIEIPLHFHLGTVPITVKELKVIQPGYIFTLGSNHKNPIAIEVNGTPVGRGELVLVDGKPAIELKELAEHGPDLC